MANPLDILAKMLNDTTSQISTLSEKAEKIREAEKKFKEAEERDQQIVREREEMEKRLNEELARIKAQKNEIFAFIAHSHLLDPVPTRQNIVTDADTRIGKDMAFLNSIFSENTNAPSPPSSSSSDHVSSVTAPPQPESFPTVSSAHPLLFPAVDPAATFQHASVTLASNSPPVSSPKRKVVGDDGNLIDINTKKPKPATINEKIRNIRNNANDDDDYDYDSFVVPDEGILEDEVLDDCVREGEEVDTASEYLPGTDSQDGEEDKSAEKEGQPGEFQHSRLLNEQRDQTYDPTFIKFPTGLVSKDKITIPKKSDGSLQGWIFIIKLLLHGLNPTTNECPIATKDVVKVASRLWNQSLRDSDAVVNQGSLSTSDAQNVISKCCMLTSFNGEATGWRGWNGPIPHCWACNRSNHPGKWILQIKGRDTLPDLSTIFNSKAYDGIDYRALYSIGEGLEKWKKVKSSTEEIEETVVVANDCYCIIRQLHRLSHYQICVLLHVSKWKTPKRYNSIEYRNLAKKLIADYARERQGLNEDPLLMRRSPGVDPFEF